MSTPKVSPTVAARLEVRDRSVYDAIVEYRRTHDYGPSYRDLCDATAISSTSIALAAVDALISRGLVEKDLGVNRSLRAIGPYPCAPKCPPHMPAGAVFGDNPNGTIEKVYCRNCGQRIARVWITVNGDEGQRRRLR